MDVYSLWICSHISLRVIQPIKESHILLRNAIWAICIDSLGPLLLDGNIDFWVSSSDSLASVYLWGNQIPRVCFCRYSVECVYHSSVCCCHLCFLSDTSNASRVEWSMTITGHHHRWLTGNIGRIFHPSLCGEIHMNSCGDSLISHPT